MDMKELLQLRKARGTQIAGSYELKPRDNIWYVPSQSRHDTYKVMLQNDMPTCTCPDYENRRIKCKHIFAVELTITKIIDDKGNIRIKKEKRITYTQNWEIYDKSQTQQKEMFLKLLNDLCKTIPQPTYEFGRPKMPLGDMVFASALKIFTTFSLRRFTTDMKIAQEKGYIQKIPHYSTVALYMENSELTPIIKDLIKISSLPLKTIEQDITVDATGFSTSRFARWFDYKYGKQSQRRVWIKAHVMSGTRTNIITAVEITPTPEHDSKFLPQLLIETAENFQVKEVSADMGYSSRNNLDAINSMNAMPYIPFKKNTKPKALGSSTWHKMWYYFLYKHDEFLQHYHKRSNAEEVFNMVKAKFGDAVRSKTETAQINEVLLKLLCHNICVVIHEIFELGIEPNFC